MDFWLGLVRVNVGDMYLVSKSYPSTCAICRWIPVEREVSYSLAIAETFLSRVYSNSESIEPQCQVCLSRRTAVSAIDGIAGLGSSFASVSVLLVSAPKLQSHGKTSPRLGFLVNGFDGVSISENSGNHSIFQKQVVL